MKKITTLLLALLLVIPAMADLKSGEKLYFKDSTGWTSDGAKIAAWVWGDNADGQWTSFIAEVSGDNTTYELVMPGSGLTFTKCKFVRFSSSVAAPDWSATKWNETGDLTIDKNLFTMTGWSYGTWSVYGSTEEPDPTLYIRGYMNGWGVTAMDYDATAKTFTWTGDISTGNEFKFDKSGSWADGANYGYGSVDAAGTYTLVNGGGNIKWNGAPGNITVTVDAEITTMTIVQNTSTELTAPEKLYLRGIDSNWDPGIEMTKDGNIFTWTGEVVANQEFKFFDGSNWLSAGGTIEENITYPFGSDDNTVWSTAGTITFVVDYTDVANPTMMAKDFVGGAVELEDLVFTVQVPEGSTTTCFIAGTFNGWALTEMTLVEGSSNKFTYTAEGVDMSATLEYKYFADNSWEHGETGLDGNRTAWQELDVVEGWEGIASYEENIVRGAMYYMHPSDEWKSDNAWFAAYFFNKNNGNFCWVQGEMLENGYVAFYLPAVTRAETDFTHVIFTRMNPNYLDANGVGVLGWSAEGETEDNKLLWSQTGDLTYPGYGNAYEINGWESEDNTGNWIDISSAVDRVEVAGGIVYANGVVAAEGAIEVYNVGGAIVARGNDNVDLRALNAGVYIVRNGNQVRKVVR